MDAPTPAGTPQGGLDLMIEWLRTKDKRKNEAAVSILCRVGEPVIEFLALEAIKPGRRPNHRVRLLDVIQRIGRPLGPADHYHISSLLKHRVAKVRDKAAEVLGILSPDGPPSLVSPEVMAAAMRLHPARLFQRALELGRFAAANSLSRNLRRRIP